LEYKQIQRCIVYTPIIYFQMLLLLWRLWCYKHD